MENVTLVCYADDKMETSQQLCIASAIQKAGIPFHMECGPHDIINDIGFYIRNHSIVEGDQRGGGKGYWIWKPYLCNSVIDSLLQSDANNPHYVVYADAGVEFIGSIAPIIEKMERENLNVFLFGNNHNHLIWCKKKVLEAMLPKWYDIHDIGLKEQVQASVIVFKVNDYTRDFTRRWLAWSEIPGFIDDSDNVGITEHYREHRNDQSILTNLAIADNIPLHWWPTQYGHYVRNKYPAGDDYGQLFYHHRWRETDWKANGLTVEQFMNQPKN